VRTCQAGNRFLGSLKDLQIRAHEADHGTEVPFTNSLQIYTKKVASKRFWQSTEQNLHYIFYNTKFTCTLFFCAKHIVKEPNIFVSMNNDFLET
jgi:hypothetical protein